MAVSCLLNSGINNKNQLQKLLVQLSRISCFFRLKNLIFLGAGVEVEKGVCVLALQENLEGFSNNKPAKLAWLNNK